MRLVRGFGEKFAILLTFRFIQITPKKVFADVLLRKQAFLNNKNMDFKKREISIFPKGIVNKYGQKVEVFHLLRLSKIDREKVFVNFVDTKEGFKDYTNICSCETQK